jgi:phage terminase large subunit-like protein
VLATDNKTLRDSIQQKIVGGEYDNYTAGTIHESWIIRSSMIKARSLGGGLLDSIKIKSVDGGITTLYFRSYEQGRENLQSLTADLVYCDEEPPQDIYGELMARLGATGGYFRMAFTPLKGMTPLVQQYWKRDNPEKTLICLSVYDAKHITPEKLESILHLYEGLNEGERNARLFGVPSAGMGQVYPASDESLKYEAFSIPDKWPRIGAIDFGRGIHPIAAVWIAISPDGTAYVYDCFKGTGLADAEVAARILARGRKVPIAYPHDFMRSTGITSIGDETKTEGWAYKEVYDRYGIQFTPECAQTEEGSIRVEVGLIQIRQAMIEGKFKIASHLSDLFDEKATYYYEPDGKPAKEKDDLMDAMRYAYVMRRYAEPMTPAQPGINTDKSDIDEIDLT